MTLSSHRVVLGYEAIYIIGEVPHHHEEDSNGKRVWVNWPRIVWGLFVMELHVFQVGVEMLTQAVIRMDKREEDRTMDDRK